VLQNLWECCRKLRKCSKISGSVVANCESAPKSLGVLSQTAKVLQNLWECCRKLRKCSKISGSVVANCESAPKSPGALSQTAKVLQNLWERCRKLRKCSKISGSVVANCESAPKSLGALSSATKPLQNLRERCRQRRCLADSCKSSENSPTIQAFCGKTSKQPAFRLSRQSVGMIMRFHFNAARRQSPCRRGGVQRCSSRCRGNSR